jgi:hypothetical protein
MIVKFPNKKTLYVACSKKCGTTSATSIMGYPRAEAHMARQMKHVLEKYNEWWKSVGRYPYSINEVNYKFAIIRNPVERLVSCFKDRVLLKNRNNIKAEVHRWGDFIHNLDYLRNHPSYTDIKRHSLPQVEILGTDVSFFDNVYNTKEISDRFLVDVSEISDIQIPPTKTKISAGVKQDINVKPDHIKIIKDYYSDDYKYWGNYFQ